MRKRKGFSCLPRKMQITLFCVFAAVRGKTDGCFYELRYKYFGGEFILPSQSVLEQKKAIVAELSERLKSSITGVVVSYEGINTEDDTKLRKELRENDVKYTVVKNTLLSRACEEAVLMTLSLFSRYNSYCYKRQRVRCCCKNPLQLC